jgi:hypothetical protein
VPEELIAKIIRDGIGRSLYAILEELLGYFVLVA